MKTVWVLDHYARERHEEFAWLNRKHYQTIRFMSAFIHNNPDAGTNRTRAESTDYGERVLLRTFCYQANNWRRSLNMVTFALQLLLKSRRRPRPDVVVASGPHLFTLVAGVLVARINRCELVVEVRDLWPRSLVELGGLKEKAMSTRILYMLERWSYRAADRIIFAFPHGQQYLDELGIKKNHIVIPNGISEALVNSNKELSVAQRNQYDFLTVYAGMLGVANNVGVILDAAKVLQSRATGKFGFLVYGNGPEREHLESRIVDEEIENVHLFKSIPREDIIAILRTEADATVFTLKPVDVFRYGISPNKIADYLAAGKPMVFSCRAGNDVAQEGECGLSVPPDDALALADALSILSNLDAAQRAAMGQRGLEFLNKHYITEQHAQTFAKFILGVDVDDRGYETKS